MFFLLVADICTDAVHTLMDNSTLSACVRGPLLKKRISKLKQPLLETKYDIIVSKRKCETLEA